MTVGDKATCAACDKGKFGCNCPGEVSLGEVLTRLSKSKPDHEQARRDMNAVLSGCPSGRPKPFEPHTDWGRAVKRLADYVKATLPPAPTQTVRDVRSGGFAKTLPESQVYGFVVGLMAKGTSDISISAAYQKAIDE